MTSLALAPDLRVVSGAGARVLTTCVLANFMAYGTFAAFNVAVPAMSREMAGGTRAASWVLLAFLLAMSSTTMILARLSDQLGRRWFYVGGVVVYAVTSLVCAVTSSDGLLIAMRVLQGVAAAASMATSTAVIADVFSEASRPAAMGVFMSFAGASAVFGPLLGGWAVDHLGWRALFWASTVFALAALLTGWGALRHVHAPPRSRFTFDVPGSVLSVVAIVALVGGVQRLGEEDGGPVVALTGLTVFLIAGGLFVLVERRAQRPMVDLDVVTGRRAGLYVSAFGTACGLNGLLVLIPLFLQVSEGYSAAAAGAVLLPMGITMLVGAPLAALLQRWTTARSLTVWGGLSIGVAALLAAGVIAADLPRAALVPLLVVAGLGHGIYQTALSGRLMEGVEPHRRGIANGVRATLINGGNALSTAVVIGTLLLVAGQNVITRGDATGATPAFATIGLLLGVVGVLGAWAAATARTAPLEEPCPS
ncbi:MFS transporter [Nocardioides bruguierae]|uniref:MFS transporter n=1 Tax=Nocardioides bruguierae TaxID=2945102 RepID=A0A9X2D8A7_9ACTN|nr:MFS transporter [Nocardioides bruguierae]MCM0621147.1 MFS transporter [Nocardioides bruguierae]